jgi:HEAT repeat protein
MDKDLGSQVAYYVALLSGDDSENAWHSLLDLGPDSLPYVRQAYYAVGDDRSRELLIQILAERRDKEAFGLFREALYSPSSAVWKAALDAIVSIGGSAAADLLRATEAKISKERRKWIIEALQQID